MKPTVAILGAGAMGKTLAGGLLRAGWRADEIVLAEKIADRAAEAANITGIETLTVPAEAAAGRDVIVVAVKPNDVGALLTEIAATITPAQLVVSLAAGVPIAVFERVLVGVPVVRTMSNTPAAVGQAMTAYSGGVHTSPELLDLAESVLVAFGETIRLDEDLLDAVTAVSGSGPAYVFLLAEAMMEAARLLGLPDVAAEHLVSQTMRGAGTLLRGADQPADELRRMVTSPGGTTEAALAVLEGGGFRDLVSQAIHAAAVRSRELGALALSDDEDA